MPCRGPQALSGALAAEAAVRQSAMLVYALGLKAIGRGGSDTFAFVSDCSRKGIPAPGLVSHCDIAWAGALATHAHTSYKCSAGGAVA